MDDTIIAIPRVDIVAHSEGGWTKSITEFDSAGVEQNISGQIYAFRTESGLDVAAVADGANPLGLKVVLTEAQMAAIFDLEDHSTKYALVNTTASPDDVKIYGRLQVEGWD